MGSTLGGEDFLSEEMKSCSYSLRNPIDRGAWRLQPIGLQVVDDLATELTHNIDNQYFYHI